MTHDHITNSKLGSLCLQSITFTYKSLAPLQRIATRLVYSQAQASKDVLPQLSVLRYMQLTAEPL